jgi:hypothetical protein
MPGAVAGARVALTTARDRSVFQWQRRMQQLFLKQFNPEG